MNPNTAIELAKLYPYDASDARLWGRPDAAPPPAGDKATLAARAVIADLKDRRGIKHGFDGVDEEVRSEIIQSLAAIIRAAMEGHDEQDS